MSSGRDIVEEIEVIMKRFGTTRKKTIHEKIKLEDGWHFKCEYLHCPHNNNGICKCILIDNRIEVKYCFCG